MHYLPYFFSRLIVAVLALAVTVPAAFGQPTPPSPRLDFSALIAAARVSGPLDFCGEPVRLEDPEILERMEREMLLVLWDPPQVILWIKRSQKYLQPIEAALRRHGLPPDLKYMAVAESALRPHAGSPKGAMGFWQFIEPTGRRYGLQVDSEKDERRNLLQSTEAAIAYLKDLYAMFGSWSLAAAAYNMGEYGLRNEIKRQEVQDYYRLYLPLETQRYLFRILTAKLVLSDPARYGITLEPGDIYPSRPVALVTVESAAPLPVLAVAKAANTDLKVIKDLNPEIRGYRLAPGRHALSIPKEAAKGFHERLAQMKPRPVEPHEGIEYVVKEGDSLLAIAARFGVSLADLATWNRLDVKKPIHAGMRLVVFPENGN
jgi:hypothetical protein